MASVGLKVHLETCGAYPIAQGFAWVTVSPKWAKPPMAESLARADEVKLIVDLIYEGGIANMNYSISNTAEYGQYVSGPRILPYVETKARMKAVLDDIQSGKFVRDFMLENAVGQPTIKASRRSNDEHQIELVGKKLRDMMPWISKGKMVDKARN
mgnify:CR=1 FL=1